jgi:hypothetical protein
MCVCVHGMELNVRDFQDKNRKPQRVRIGKRVLVFS